MRKKYDYEATVQLKHNEVPAIQNLDTGEVSVQLPKEFTKKKTAEGTVPFERNAIFHKNYKKSWDFLYYRLSPLEYKVAHYLAQSGEINTNSLKPLNDDYTIQKLAETVAISTGKVKAIFDRLFQMGVYGKFELVEKNKEYTKFWILNPFLAFNGTTLPIGIIELFKNTEIAQAFKS